MNRVTANWQTYEPTEAEPWNLQRVVHLHRRAGFGAPWDVLQRDLVEGPQAAVDRLLEGQSRANQDGDFETMARTIGDAAMASGSPGRLKAWWFYRMLLSPDPLGERLTLMWHNHFATSNRKVQDLVLMREQNELFRKHARSPFPGLLAAVVKHPAMLVWLDADSNRKGHPNENLARELMELFTLGVGNYSEDDVKEAARALTGWTIVGGSFGFREARHDEDAKSLLGTQGQLTGDDLIEILCEQPATAQRLAWRICHTFMGEGVVSEEAFTQLAEGLAAHDLDIGWGVETVLRSDMFFSTENMRTRVSGPVEYLVGSLRSLELCDPPPSTLLLAEWAARMGQDLFYPPNVGGWNEGRAWLGSRTIIARANFAATLAQGQLWHPTLEPDIGRLLKRHCADVEIERGTNWLATLLWGEAPAALVEQVVAQVRSTESPNPLPAVVALLLARPEHQMA
jgi:hypothetical protein